MPKNRTRSGGAAFALLLVALAPAALAEGWVYPGRDFQDAEGRWAFPTSDGRVFDSALAREEYLRRSRDIRLRTRAVEAEAERRRREAAAERRVRGFIPSVPPAPSIAGERLEDEQEELRRLQRAAAVAAQQEQHRRLERFLARGDRRDAATTRADLADRRAAQARRIAESENQLYGRAETERKTLGQSERRPIGPLIRIPRID